MKKILDFYINSSIHVALAVVSLTLITSINLELKVNTTLLLFTFFGTVTGYNFVKYSEVAGLHHRSLTKSLRNIQVFSFICFTGLVITAFFLPFEILLSAALFGACTLLYALPIFSKRRNLRSVSGLKIFIIAFVWAGVTVVLPAIGAKNDILEDLLLESFQRFLLVLVWILPFEIRDLKYDLEQLGTIPQRIGITPTKISGLSTLAIVILMEGFKSNNSAASTTALLITCVISGLFVWASKEKRSIYFSAFWVEAIPIFWIILLLVLRGL